MALVSSIFYFFIYKIALANKWMRKIIPSCSNSALVIPFPSQGADYALCITTCPLQILRPSFGSAGYDDIALLLPRRIFKSTVQRIICIFTAVCEFGIFVGLHCQNNRYLEIVILFSMSNQNYTF